METDDIDNLIQNLQESINKITKLINQFPKKSREEKLIGEWSLKDLLSHFNGWNVLTISDLNKFKNNEIIDEWIWGDKMDEFNRKQVDMRSSNSWNEVYDEFTQTNEELVKVYTSLSEDQWNKHFGPTKDSTPLRSIKIDIDHFGKDHIEDISNALKNS